MSVPWLFSAAGLLMIVAWTGATAWRGDLPSRDLLSDLLIYLGVPLAGLVLLLAGLLAGLQNGLRRAWIAAALQRPDLDWRLREELNTARQAPQRLQEALQQAEQYRSSTQALEQRLKALERLSERETAVSQAEARGREQLAQAQQQAQAILDTAQQTAAQLEATAAAQLTAWRRDVTNSQAAARQANAQLRQVLARVHRIQTELRYAQQEQRPVCFPKLYKELRRLARLAPADEATDEQAHPPTDRVPEQARSHREITQPEGTGRPA